MAPSRQSGFTLTEALITLAILSFAMTGILQLHANLLLATGLGKARSEALALAEARLETLRSVTEAAPYEPTSDSLPDLAGTNSLFELQWDIAPVEGGALYALQARVRWTDAQGTQREVWLPSRLPTRDPAWVARALE